MTEDVTLSDCNGGSISCNNLGSVYMAYKLWLLCCLAFDYHDNRKA